MTYFGLSNSEIERIVAEWKDPLPDWESQQRTDYILAEYFAERARQDGHRASELMSAAQGGYVKHIQEWVHHRLHLLDPDRYFHDYWAISADNVIEVLPLDGTLLNLCCGDGFYDRHFFSKRARLIVGVDHDPFAIQTAKKFHAAPNIEYVCSDVLRYEPSQTFDAVVIRGAIEHFTPGQQEDVFRLAWRALEQRGYFCGDTALPAGKSLHHKHEWTSTLEAEDELGKVFTNTLVKTLVSHERTTILWQCRKA